MDVDLLELGAKQDDYAPQKRAFLWLLPKREVPIPTQDERKPFPYKKANVLLKIFYTWMIPLFTVGYRRTVTSNDLYLLTDDFTVELYNSRFNLFWSELVPQFQEKWKQKNPDKDDGEFVLSSWQLMWILIKTFKRDLICSQVFICISFSAMSVLPVVSKYMINFVGKRSYGLETGYGKGVGYAIAQWALLVIIGILFNQYFFRSVMVGTKIKLVLTKQILDKLMRLSPKLKHKFDDAKITSFILTDLSRIEFGLMFVPMLPSMPIPIAVLIVILVVNIGVSAVIGIIIFLVFLMSMGLPMKNLVTYRNAGLKVTDQRVLMTRQVLHNLKMIKFYSWENLFIKKLRGIRDGEVHYVMKIQTLRSLITGVALTLPGTILMIAFLILYGLEGKTRNPALMFSSLLSFEIITLFVFFIPMILSSFADILAGLTRIGSMLSLDEFVPYPGYITTADVANNTAISVMDGLFEWEEFDDEVEDNDEDKKTDDKKGKKKWFGKKKKKSPSPETPVLEKKTKTGGNFPGLNNINLEIERNEFVIVTGVIGLGKTLLLNAISGFMTETAGSVTVNGDLLFSGDPWVQNTTIRDNITFGLPFDRKWYEAVIAACSLGSDLDVLPGGDMTEVGERGITLSGGQKARLNLARAVYANKDIIVMDDVLLAVDARVGKHMVSECFLGLLKDKTRILATHQLALISAATKVIFVRGDGLIDVGSVDELSLRNPQFEKLLTHVKSFDDDDDEIEEKVIISKDLVVERVELILDEEEHHYEADNAKNAALGKIIEKEEVAVNQIGLEVWIQYIKHGAGKLTWIGWLILFVILLTLCTFCELFTNTWLSFWVSQKWPDRLDGFYIGLYVMFNMMWVILMLITLNLLVRMMITALKQLHVKAIDRILHTPMRYLDVTPMGRVLNRFTKDTDALDNEILENSRQLFLAFARMIGILILCIIYIPWVALVIPAVFIVLFVVANFYLSSAREIKRLEALHRSFVLNNFNESLGGAATIKLYHQQSRFMHRNDVLVNHMNEATFLVNAGQRWFEISLDTFGSFILLLVLLLCVCGVFKLSAALVGLLLTYVVNMARLLLDVTRMYAQVEVEMNSAERIEYYALNLDQEAPPSLPTDPSPHEWPLQGAIKFDQVCMRYRPNLPLVLDDLSFSIAPGEKVGICGRTGAGKSLIMTALYRIVELTSGKITIDDVDISKLGLHTLRSQLLIIPQDPVLFNGTIRLNLDPFGEATDDQLWSALRRAHVISADDLDKILNVSDVEAKGEIASVESEESQLHKFHLDQVVEDDGVNFSLGERQLLAFARALIRNTKILIMDEATSLVDYETDYRIQQTIKEEFADCAILCIAHRLKTIITYDRIMVLDRGHLAEFDTPFALFEHNGIFRQMCDKANIGADDFHE